MARNCSQVVFRSGQCAHHFHILLNIKVYGSPHFLCHSAYVMVDSYSYLLLATRVISIKRLIPVQVPASICVLKYCIHLTFCMVHVTSLDDRIGHIKIDSQAVDSTSPTSPAMVSYIHKITVLIRAMKVAYRDEWPNIWFRKV